MTEFLTLPELSVAELTAMYLGPTAIGHDSLPLAIEAKDSNKKNGSDWPDDAPTRSGDAPPGGDNPSKEGGGRDDSQTRRKD